MPGPSPSAEPRASLASPPAPITTTAANGHEVIRLDGASRMFDGVVAVRDLTLSVPRGTILGLIGPSGAGKTTAIRMLTGAIAPSRGKVRVFGEDPRVFHRRTRERIGYMPQLFTLYPDLTAQENVAFMASLFGLLFFRRRRRVREVLQLVDLWPARRRRAGRLSGGMQRRLELACALVHEPALLFLDEPTAGIDPLLRARVWEELHRQKAAGRTLIVTTQYVNEASECDNVALIANGRLAALATPVELRRQASGGDVVEVETAAPFEASGLTSMVEVRSVETTGPHSFRVTVDDAGSATPAVMAAIDDAGGEVVSARESRPSFDQVFTTLVERHRQAEGGEGGEAPTMASTEEAPRPPGAGR